LPGTTVSGSRIQPRTGAQILACLAVPLNVTLLRELQTGPKLLDELRQASGTAPRRVLRSHLGALGRLGIVARRGPGLFPALREYALAEPGRELRFVMVALERWFAASRGERFELDSDDAGDAIEMVLDAWSSTVMRALAARPCSLSELDELVEPLSHASLGRRVEAMRRAGLLETTGHDGEGSSYVRTAWLCRAMGPLVAASRWERRNLRDRSAPIGCADAETALLLTMPLLQLPPTARGSCRLVVDVSDGNGEPPATVTAVADGCRIASYEAASRNAAASASGPPSAWFRAAIEANPDHIAVDGDRRLAKNVLDALYAALYSLRAPTISHRI
jgi:DNA-binding HxlR family transcriptional regulator